MKYKLMVTTVHTGVDEEDLKGILRQFLRHGHSPEDLERLQKEGTLTISDEWWPRGREYGVAPIRISSTVTLGADE